MNESKKREESVLRSSVGEKAHATAMIPWAFEFYARQEELGLVYTSDGFWSSDKIRFLAPHLGEPGKRILELGAGGGQNACELARLGHQVTAVELVPRLADHAKQLAKELPHGALTVVTGDFYEVSLPVRGYAYVCYWDGFGLGDDREQRVLLRRVCSWLRPEGKALIDIYTPWFAASTVGREYSIGKARRRYDYDFEGSRWLDSWWPEESQELTVTQSLRCYSPADLRLLLEGTGLKLEQIIPGGGFERGSNAYSFPSALEDAISYTAILSRS